MDVAKTIFDDHMVVLVVPPRTKLNSEFVERVRIMTIPDYQAFSPVPWQEYKPEFVYVNRAIPDEPELNNNYGFFDKDNFDFFSFYLSDYLKAMSKLQQNVNVINLHDLFFNHTEMHVFRGMEPSLRLKYRPLCYRQESDSESTNFQECVRKNAHRMATRPTLARIYLDYLEAHNITREPLPKEALDD